MTKKELKEELKKFFNKDFYEKLECLITETVDKYFYSVRETIQKGKERKRQGF